jgi:zinc protease
MMFKGSSCFAAGEIDSVTQSLGGSNNAFTSHDCVLYHFSFSSDRWKQALKIESDRMASLTLDQGDVDSERLVILEELSQAENDPWDALESEVRSELYEDHPYGKRILGSRESLEALGQDRLRDFYEKLYFPGNAVLVVVGDVDSGARDEIRSQFNTLRDGCPRTRLVQPGSSRSNGLRRVERHSGEVARFLAALPGPSARSRDFGPARLLISILAGGRSSRLYRTLVDESQLCTSVMADLAEVVDPGAMVFALEVVPGIEPAAVEDQFWNLLRHASETGFTENEVSRAKRIFMADWVYGFETVQSQAVSLAQALCLFDPGYLESQRAQVLATTPTDLLRVAQGYLRPDAGGVVGWSLPGSE